MNICQFDIVLAQLNPVKGKEQGGRRPVVVLQTNAAERAGTYLVAPLSSQKVDRLYPCEVLLSPTAANGLSAPSKVKLDQIRVIDASRLVEHRGHIEDSYHEEIFQAMDLIFDRRGEFR